MRNIENIILAQEIALMSVQIELMGILETSKIEEVISNVRKGLFKSQQELREI